MSGVPRFARRFFDPEHRLTRLGEGELGGKAQGLARAQAVLAALGPGSAVPGIALDIPALTVLGSGFFDSFIESNGLEEVLAREASDREISEAFHKATVPAGMVGDLRALAAEVRVPLAVRSS